MTELVTIIIKVPTEDKDRMINVATRLGETVSEFICNAVNERSRLKPTTPKLTLVKPK